MVLGGGRKTENPEGAQMYTRRRCETLCRVWICEAAAQPPALLWYLLCCVVCFFHALNLFFFFFPRVEPWSFSLLSYKWMKTKMWAGLAPSTQTAFVHVSLSPSFFFSMIYQFKWWKDMISFHCLNLFSKQRNFKLLDNFFWNSGSTLKMRLWALPM